MYPVSDQGQLSTFPGFPNVLRKRCTLKGELQFLVFTCVNQLDGGLGCQINE